MKALLICLLLVNPIKAMQEEKISHPSEIIRYHRPGLPESIQLEPHHHTKKSITITVEDKQGHSPPVKQLCCSSKVKITAISASALIVTSGLSAFIAWKSKQCGN